MSVNWVEEEIRLLLSFYDKMQSGEMHKTHPMVIEASNEIRNLEINKEYSEKDPKFRNPNGIALKMANFLFLDPNYSGKGMKGCSLLDKIIFNEFYMIDISQKVDIGYNNSKYPFKFENWFSSNNGGVRRPLDENSGRPLGNEIIEGKIHLLIKEMIQDYVKNKGKYVCVFIGGPGNGKTDIMEYAAKEFVEMNGSNWDEIKIDLLLGFNDNNRHTNIELKGGDCLILTQDASQRDSDSKDFCDAILSDFRKIDAMKQGLCVICMNRGILEEIKRRAAIDTELLNAYKDLIQVLYRSNTLDASILDMKIWGNETVNPYKLFTWSMDFDTLFDVSHKMNVNSNLISMLFTKGNCIANYFTETNELSPLYSAQHFIQDSNINLSYAKILRSHEIINGKRFTYREIFNLTGYLLNFTNSQFTSINSNLNSYFKTAREAFVERFIILFELYKETYSYRFFGGFMQPTSNLRDESIKAHTDRKKDDLKMLFNCLINKDKLKDSPDFIGLTKFFDPIYCSDFLEITDENGKTLTLDELTKKIIYNTKFNIEDYKNLITPLEIEIINCLFEIKDEYCLSINTDQINLQKLNALDSLKSFFNILILSFIKRALFFSKQYFKDKMYINEYIGLVEGEYEDKEEFTREIFMNSFKNEDNDKINISLVTSIGQTASQFINNVSFDAPTVFIKPIKNPENNLPSMDQLILQTNESDHENTIVITYKLFREIKRGNNKLLDGCFDKNFLLWKELKKGELVSSNLKIKEIKIHQIGNIKIDNYPTKIVPIKYTLK
jgi:hypothetical protein